MNYVKHLSIALLVLASSAVLASAGAGKTPTPKGKITGATSPDKQTSVLIEDASGKQTASIQNGFRIDPNLLAAGEHCEGWTDFAWDAKDNKWTAKRKDGTAIDLTPTYAPAAEDGFLKKVKTYVKKAHELPLLYKAGAVAAVGGVGVAAYYNSEGFKKFVDGQMQNAQDFVSDVQEGKNGARTKLAVVGGVAGIAGVATWWKWQAIKDFWNN